MKRRLRAPRPTWGHGDAAVRGRIVRDPWARALGIAFARIGPGHGRATLRLTPRMLNFQGAPHGGVIFSLADAAFSAACNGHGEAAVALSVTISYLSAAPPRARLVAEARQLHQGRRAGFYEVTVTVQAGAVVAHAHAVAHRLGLPLLALPARRGSPAPAARSGAGNTVRTRTRETGDGAGPRRSSRASRLPAGGRRRGPRQT